MFSGYRLIWRIVDNLIHFLKTKTLRYYPQVSISFNRNVLISNLRVVSTSVGPFFFISQTGTILDFFYFTSFTPQYTAVLNLVIRDLVPFPQNELIYRKFFNWWLEIPYHLSQVYVILRILLRSNYLTQFNEIIVHGKSKILSFHPYVDDLLKMCWPEVKVKLHLEFWREERGASRP